MSYKDQVNKAIDLGEIKENQLEEVSMCPIKDCLSEEEMKIIRQLSTQIKPKHCIDNAYIVSQAIGCDICEGVAYIVPEAGPQCDGKADWVRHSWNRKGELYFDVTIDPSYRDMNLTEGGNIIEIHYFVFKKWSHELYKSMMECGKDGILPETIRIEDVLKCLNNEEYEKMQTNK